MNILSFDYDEEHNCAWIQIDGKYKGEQPYTVQCCTVEGRDKEIKISDCGHDWGLCEEANEKAFKNYGENRCMKALFSKAKQNGFTIY
jgi:hypothetical protein